MKSILKIIKTKRGYQIRNTQTKVTYTTVFKTKVAAEAKCKVMRRWFVNMMRRPGALV